MQCPWVTKKNFWNETDGFMLTRGIGVSEKQKPVFISHHGKAHGNPSESDAPGLRENINFT